MLAEVEDATHCVRGVEREIRAFLSGALFPHKQGDQNGQALVDLLRTAPGVGEVTAWVWLAEIVDPSRCPDAKAVAASCGHDPSLKVSAGKVTSQARRKGNTALHQVFVQAAQYVIRKPGSPLGAWGRSISAKHAKGGWLKACGAVARRLTVALYHMHRTLKPYDESGYLSLQKPSFPDVKVEEMGLTKRTTTLLLSHGIRRATELWESYLGTLAALPGVGAKTLEEIGKWFAKFRGKTRETAAKH